MKKVYSKLTIQVVNLNHRAPLLGSSGGGEESKSRQAPTDDVQDYNGWLQ